MKMKRVIAPVIGALLLLTAVVFSVPPPPDPSLSDRKGHLPPPAVHTDTVQRMTSVRSLRFPSIIQASSEATLAFAIPGRIVERLANVGDEVRKGDVLFRMDDREFKNGVALAESKNRELKIRLDQILRDYERVRHLKEVKAATEEEVEHLLSERDAVSALYKSSLVSLSEAMRMLSETVLTAPFDGTVTQVLMETGEFIHPGNALVELTGSDGREIEIEVPETVIGTVKEGQTVTVELPFQGNRSVGGMIHSVTRASAQTGRLFLVVVQINENSEVIPGFTAEVILPVTLKDRLTVPFHAVLDPGSSTPCVFRIENRKVQKIPVALSEMIGNRVVVEGRIGEGDTIVVSGHTALSESDEVEVTR